jgi:hypothetical protein
VDRVPEADVSKSADTVSIDIHRPTERAVGDRVHVIFNEDGWPLRLITEPGGDWVVTSVESLEPQTAGFGPPLTGARITLRRERTTA